MPIKPFRIRANREITFDTFMFPEGESMIVDETVVNGPLHLATSIYTLPVLEWIAKGLVSVEPFDMETHVCNDMGRPYLEPMFHYIRANGLKCDVGAEIGVYMGGNAMGILDSLPIRKLYLIDPYHENPTFQPWNVEALARIKAETIARMKPYGDRVEWIFRRSDEAYKMIDDPLDFVYHDSIHTMEAVYSECLNFRSLVKPGGIHGGHDYGSITYFREGRRMHDVGVIFAVSRFLERYPRDLFWSNVHANWWTRKGESEE